MCGILALLLKEGVNPNENLKNLMLQQSRIIRHRGPDSNGCYVCNNGIFLHERLSIIDPYGGSQPIVDNKNSLILLVNGEIYNHLELRKKYSDYDYQTNSDCEIINAIYNHFKLKYNNQNLTKNIIYELFSELNGQFSFVLHDEQNNMTLVGRDPFGITPLYYGVDKDGNFYVSSEMKALKLCDKVFAFEAGNYMYFNGDFTNTICKPYFKNTYEGLWINEDYEYFNVNNTVYEHLRTIFTKAVIDRLMADVPFGVLLSGGLDSSLVSSITQKFIKENPDFNPYIKALNSFSIGLKDSPDLLAAQKTADFLGTHHHNFIFTIEEGINALRDVIYHLETYDITTIRASTPMYLLSRKIKSLGFKMVLSGEGSDELLGGYLYFHNAPNDKEHQMECKKRILNLGYFDCLRANKSTMAWGLEARVPFLDKKIVNYCINIPHEVKGVLKNTDIPRMEKHLIRKAFDINDENGNPIYLPKDILWRQKEQFSDGVGYGWIDYLKEYTEKQVDQNYLNDFNIRHLLYPFNTPQTKEAFYYRVIFEEMFPNRAETVKGWIPKMDWDGVNADPSGRAQSTHTNTTV